jgi:hypothetical protein
MRHEKRELPLAVGHLTSPGFVEGRSRQESRACGVEGQIGSLPTWLCWDSTLRRTAEELRRLREEFDPKGGASQVSESHSLCAVAGKARSDRAL